MAGMLPDGALPPLYSIGSNFAAALSVVKELESPGENRKSASEGKASRPLTTGFSKQSRRKTKIPQKIRYDQKPLKFDFENSKLRYFRGFTGMA